MLHIIGTPIGHPEDITLRALKALQACTYVLAEDTRVTKPLLQYHHITVPLKSYHAFSERKHLNKILEDLEAGAEIGLVSDAGMPGISDPGSLLITSCKEASIPLTVYPGPSALTTALVHCGLAAEPFQFRGFFPKKKQAEEVATACFYAGVTVYYEAPHRIKDTLALFPPSTKISFARELTKRYEEVQTDTAASLLSHFSEVEPRGEFVLVVHGNTPPYNDPKVFLSALQTTYGLDQKTALKVACDILGIPKRTLYKQCHDMPQTE